MIILVLQTALNSKINTISSHFKHLHGLDLLSISLLSNSSTDLKDKPKAESKAILNAIQNTPKKLTEYLFKTGVHQNGLRF